MADVYRIGVSIAMTGPIQQQLAMLGRQFLGIHTTAGQITNQFNRWALALGGVAAVMGGSAIIGGIVKLAEHGKEVAHQLELMKIKGMEFGEIQEANARALEVTSTVLTTTYSGNLKHISELRYAFGGTADAMQYLEAVSKANAVLNAVKGGAGGVDQVWELVKSLEQKGLTTTPEEFLSYADAMTKAVVATGGKVTPAMFQSAFKYGRTAMLGWDESFIGEILPRLIQSMATSGGGGGGGSGGPGNALMTGFRQIVSGIMSKPAAELFGALGLANVTHAHGTTKSFTRVDPGLQDQFIRDPYEAIQKYIMPALVRRFGRDQNTLIKELGILFPVRTFGAAGTEMGLQGRYMLGDQSPFEKDRRLTQLAMGVNAYDDLITRDPTTVIAAFHAQMKNLGETLGAPIWAPGGMALKAISSLTVMLNSMARFAGAHPEGVTLMLQALAVLGGMLVGGGVIALVGAIFRLGLAGGGISLAASALLSLAALNWKSIQEPIEKLVALINSLSGRGLPPNAVGERTPASPSWWENIIPGSWFKGRGVPPGAPGYQGNLPGNFNERWAPFDTPAPFFPSVPSVPSAPSEAPHAPTPFGHFKKQSYNAVPPPSGGAEGDLVGTIQMDGQKVGDIVLGHVARGASRAIEGSAYLDGTRPSYTSDMSLSYG